MLHRVKSNLAIEQLVDVLNSDNNQLIEYRQLAEKKTDEFFGNKRKLFNPIYVSNICLADCPYCGYRVSNKKLSRKTLKPKESIQEAQFLKNRGVENILVLAGDYKHDKYLEMLIANIKAIKETVNLKWLGVEVATLEVEEYRKLKEIGVESVTVFQETYDKKRYELLHQNPEYKGNFNFRKEAQERVIQAGIKQVGFGVLYGVGFWMDDTIGMAEHAHELLTKYPNAQIRFSFPRLQTSVGQSEDCKTDLVTEEQLSRAVIGIRLAFPSAEIVLTGRESLHFLSDHFSLATTLGFNGATSVGGYSINKDGLKQFELDNVETFDAFTNQLLNKRYELI